MSLLAFTPFIQPAPLWDQWPWLLLPLTLGLSVIYKSIRCRTMREVPRATLHITLSILIGMAAAAAALYLIVHWQEM